MHHNSVTVGSDIVVAEYDGKIVETVGAIKNEFCYNDETFVGRRHIDPVMDVSMRGKGVFFKIFGTLNELSPMSIFSYTLPNNQSCRGFAKYGFQSNGSIHIQYCQLSFLKSGLKEKLRFIMTGAKLIGKDGAETTSGSLDEVKDLTPALPPNKYCFTRDLYYLNWRYAESPVKKNDILIHRHHHQVVMAKRDKEYLLSILFPIRRT